MFEKNDVVVCVNAKPDEADPMADLLTERKTYRVSNAGARSDGVFALVFKCFPSRTPGNGYAFSATRFRKLKAPDTEISASIKACRPAHRKTPVDA